MIPGDWAPAWLLGKLRTHRGGIFARHQLAAMAVFGLPARERQPPDGTLGVLATFTKVPSLFDLVRLEMELSDLLGIPVDVGRLQDLKPHVAHDILGEAVFL